MEKMRGTNNVDCALCYRNVSSGEAVKIGVEDEKSVDATTDDMRHKAHVSIDDRPNAGKARKNEQRQLTCDFCQKKFNHTGDFNKHRRKHTGERPYTCIKCQQKFSHVSNLVRHQRVHSGIRPFSCEICGRAFARKDKLSDHLTAKSCSTKVRNKNRSIATKHKL